MQKKGLIFILGIFLINFVNAQFFSGYNRFSFRDILDRTDPQMATLVILFLIFFTLIFIVLMRFSLFKNAYGEPHRAGAGIISLGTSALITYWMYIRGFDFSGFFFDIGLSPDSLYGIFPLLFLIFAIVLIWKTSFRMFLFLMGILLILLTIFTDVFYAEGLVAATGAVLILISWWLWRRSRGLSSVRNALGTVADTYRGGRDAYRRGREHIDPRNRLQRKEYKKEVKIEKRLAKEEIKKLKEIRKSHKKALKEERRRRGRREGGRIGDNGPVGPRPEPAGPRPRPGPIRPTPEEDSREQRRIDDIEKAREEAFRIQKQKLEDERMRKTARERIEELRRQKKAQKYQEAAERQRKELMEQDEKRRKMEMKIAHEEGLKMDKRRRQEEEAIKEDARRQRIKALKYQRDELAQGREFKIQGALEKERKRLIGKDYEKALKEDARRQRLKEAEYQVASGIQGRRWGGQDEKRRKMEMKIAHEEGLKMDKRRRQEEEAIKEDARRQRLKEIEYQVAEGIQGRRLEGQESERKRGVRLAHKEALMMDKRRRQEEEAQRMDDARRNQTRENQIKAERGAYNEDARRKELERQTNREEQQRMNVEKMDTRKREQWENKLRKAEKIASKKTLRVDRAAAVFKNAEKRFVEAQRINKGVHSAERSYNRMYDKLKKAEAEYQEAQLALAEARNRF
ncbi:MAG TPA: hypothetical protein ENH99_01360 [Candidatus Pacearchaeota archaeon]|nr:hypothetical protein [Candidatus Pacearchaeota archaeon]